MRDKDYQVVASLMQNTISTGYTYSAGKPELAKVRITDQTENRSKDVWLSSVGLRELIDSLEEIESIIDQDLK